MKNYFIITLLLFSVYFTQAQIINFPDANFKNALINTNCYDYFGSSLPDSDIDFNDDGEIDVSEAIQVDNLHLDDRNIESLEGIEYFTNLELLYCKDNYIQSLDFSTMPNFKTLRCRNNEISSINITQNIELEVIVLSSNELTDLDTSQNINLKEIWASNNSITSVDVTNNVNLEALLLWNNDLSSIDVSNNPLLREFTIDMNDLITSIDVSNNPVLYLIDCSSNDNLSYLNLRNGNQTGLIFVDARDNTNLFCIEVDDVDYANSQGSWQKENWTSYEEECFLGVNQSGFLESISIYPNPVQNNLKINTDFPIDYIKIYTLQGQLINETKNKQIDVSLLSSGLYFASITIDGKNSIKKFIKI